MSALKGTTMHPRCRHIALQIKRDILHFDCMISGKIGFQYKKEKKTHFSYHAGGLGGGPLLPPPMGQRRPVDTSTESRRHRSLVAPQAQATAPDGLKPDGGLRGGGVVLLGLIEGVERLRGDGGDIEGGPEPPKSGPPFRAAADGVVGTREAGFRLPGDPGHGGDTRGPVLEYRAGQGGRGAGLWGLLVFIFERIGGLVWGLEGGGLDDCDWVLLLFVGLLRLPKGVEALGCGGGGEGEAGELWKRERQLAKVWWEGNESLMCNRVPAVICDYGKAKQKILFSKNIEKK